MIRGVLTMFHLVLLFLALRIAPSSAEELMPLSQRAAASGPLGDQRTASNPPEGELSAVPLTVQLLRDLSSDDSNSHVPLPVTPLPQDPAATHGDCKAPPLPSTQSFKVDLRIVEGNSRYSSPAPGFDHPGMQAETDELGSRPRREVFTPTAAPTPSGPQGTWPWQSFPLTLVFIIASTAMLTMWAAPTIHDKQHVHQDFRPQCTHLLSTPTWPPQPGRAPPRRRC